MSDTLLIYFVQMGRDGPIKIGRARNAKALTQRFRALQTANCEPLYLRGVISGCGTDEGRLHAEFARYRLTGEWFQPSPEIMELVGKSQPPDGVLLATKRAHEQKLEYEDAKRVWLDDAIGMTDAIDMMPGWSVITARKAFGHRPEASKVAAMDIEKQREHGRKGGEIVRSRSARVAWQTRAYAERRRAAAVVWRDPAHDGWEQARAALPEDLQKMSFTTLWRLLGPRNPKAKGRGRPKTS